MEHASCAGISCKECFPDKLENGVQSRASKLQLILESYAPTEKDREYLRSIYHEMAANHETPEVVEKQIITAMADGVMYGNWPWDRSHMSKLDRDLDTLRDKLAGGDA